MEGADPEPPKEDEAAGSKGVKRRRREPELPAAAPRSGARTPGKSGRSNWVGRRRPGRRVVETRDAQTNTSWTVIPVELPAAGELEEKATL